MTDQPAQWMSSAPGWYPDPAGSGRSRWWDGRVWTGHLYPAPTNYGLQQRPMIHPQAPVYNGMIWSIVLAPLVLVLLQLLWNPERKYIYLYGERTIDPFSIYTPWYFLLLFASLLMYAGTVIAAYFDWKKLGRDGVVRPFHWAWTFLSPLVYVIGRSVIISKVAPGRGWAPTGAAIAVEIVVVSVGFAHMASVMTSMVSDSGY